MSHPVVHFEIGCKDKEKTSAFYRSVFGWTIASGPMGLIDTGASSGIQGHIAALGHEPHQYTHFYVETADIAGSLKEVGAAGSKTIVPGADSLRHLRMVRRRRRQRCRSLEVCPGPRIGSSRGLRFCDSARFSISGRMVVSDAPATRNWLRSVAAIFLGFVAVVILSLGTDLLLHAIGLYPVFGQRMSDPLLALAAVYRTLYGIVGAYITARFAPARPMPHALIGGVIGFVLAVIGLVVSWNHAATMGPHWYPMALVITALPSAWAGGYIRVIQLRSR